MPQGLLKDKRVQSRPCREKFDIEMGQSGVLKTVDTPESLPIH
jgi:hypothetical protein